YGIDAGVSAAELTAPGILAFVRGRELGVLRHTGEALELEKCSRPIPPVTPAVATFPGGLIVAQSCASGLVVSRFGASPTPERTVELPGFTRMFAMAVIDSTRIAIARSPDEANPSVTLLRLEDLSETRTIPLEPLRGCAAGLPRLVVDPLLNGRFAVEMSRVSGHSNGCASLTRVDACEVE
ncbi:MAG: hypothetical protein INH41_23035, partial [Myxococcaceae bacterium]|nr:hypothetical protein [Myxococcaceae bacterium]